MPQNSAETLFSPARSRRNKHSRSVSVCTFSLISNLKELWYQEWHRNIVTGVSSEICIEFTLFLPWYTWWVDVGCKFSVCLWKITIEQKTVIIFSNFTSLVLRDAYVELESLSRIKKDMTFSLSPFRPELLANKQNIWSEWYPQEHAHSRAISW
jgi:hypothetical protein